MSNGDNSSYNVHGFAPRRTIPTRQQSTAMTVTSDGRLVPRESLPEHTQAPTTHPRGQHLGAPTRSMTAPSTFPAPSGYHQPAFYPQNDWQRRWGGLQPGTSVIMMENNTMSAGRSMNVISEGNGTSTMDIERNHIRTPKLYLSAEGNTVGMNIGRGDRGNKFDVENDFTIKSKLTGQAEQTHRTGPAPANGHGPPGYGHPANGHGPPTNGSNGHPTSGYGPAANGYGYSPAANGYGPANGWGPPANDYRPPAH